VIFTIRPIDSDTPFICSSGLILIQDGLQTEAYKLTQDPAGENDSQCGDVVVPTSFALSEWTYQSPKIDLEKTFEVFWDLGDNEQRFTIFAYDPSDYDLEPPPDELSNDTGISGLFFDPSNSGHGFDINKHKEALIIYYYGHTEFGERLWLITDNYYADLDYSEEIELELYEVAEGTFGHPNPPATKWGTLYIEFTDCDSGLAKLVGFDGTIEFPFVRLTRLRDIGCQ
jgi:hypothetical protein